MKPLHISSDILKQIEAGVIVSVQADEGEPLDSPEILAALALSALQGGASGLRMANPENIRHIKTFEPEIPLIGITKPHHIPTNFRELVYITPTFEDVCRIVEAGADIVAIDATSRLRPNGDTLDDAFSRVRQAYPQLPLMADISRFEEGIYAASLGFNIISTTLSGYTSDTMLCAKSGEPDFELLKKLVDVVEVPVILEGRIWEPWHVSKAFELGAFAVVIGSAITRPFAITHRFVEKSPLNQKASGLK